MYAMNMESLVAVVVGVIVGWAVSPMARFMMWAEKLTGSLVRYLKGTVNLSHCDTAPSFSVVWSRRKRHERRTFFARGRPVDTSAQLQRSDGSPWLTV
jgi:hypothetical protein